MKLPPWKPTDIDVCRVDFDYIEFRKAVFTKGLRFWWEYGTPCPCREIMVIGHTDTHTSDTYQAKTGCAWCDGSGVLFSDGQLIRGITSWSSEKPTLGGRWVNFMKPGDVHVSLLREHLPGENDRFILLDDQIVMSESRKRVAGVGELERMRFPVVPKTLNLGAEHGGEEPEPTPTTIGVLSMRVAGTDGVTLSRVPREGVDFEIRDGLIDWALGDALGTAPPVGGYYGARYHTYPIYRVSHTPHNVRVPPYLDDAGVQRVGDGPVEVILSPTLLGALDNPSATFLPDLSCCE